VKTSIFPKRRQNNIIGARNVLHKIRCCLLNPTMPSWTP